MPKNTKLETWLSVKIDGYENYIVSSLGVIINRRTGAKLNPTISGGYYSVNLCNYSSNNRPKLFRVHRIVAFTFIENPDPKKLTSVDHINNNKLDNRVVNLRWITPKGNSKSYINNHRKKFGNRILQYDLNMNLVKEWENLPEVVKENSNYTRDNLYNSLCKGTTAYNYIWTYKNKKKNKIQLEDDEEFKTIGILDGRDFSNYEVSNYGKVRNISRKTFLKISNNLLGYPFVTLNDKSTGKGYTKVVHYYVATLFIGPKPHDKNLVNHIDEDKTNNYYRNLEWATHGQNSLHSVAKKVNQIDINTGKVIKTFNSIKEAKASIGIKNDSITKCCNGKRDSVKGYKWRFV